MKHIASLIVLSFMLWLTGCGQASSPLLSTPAGPIINASTPIVVNSTPAWFVGTNRLVYAQFSIDMDPSTITPTSFVVEGVQGTVHYEPKNRIAYFTPAGLLAQNTTYKVTLTEDIKGANGQPMPIPYTFKFNTRTTTDTSAPTVWASNPGCVSVNGPVTVEFDEPMDSSTINTSTFLVDGVTGTVAYNPINSTATFTPTTPFATGTTYNGTITTGALDLGEVPISQDYHFTFTTCPANTGGGYCSYTKGGYANEGAPGKFFDAHFSSVFFNDLVIGIYDGAGAQTSARFTANDPGPADLKTYLTSPAHGPSAAFPADVTNPTATVNGQLPEQTATLALNIGFSGVAGDPAGFGDLILTGTGGSLDGMSVRDILGVANYALAGDGLPQGYTFSDLNDLVTNLNQSYDDCTQTGWGKQHLTAPTQVE